MFLTKKIDFPLTQSNYTKKTQILYYNAIICLSHHTTSLITKFLIGPLPLLSKVLLLKDIEKKLRETFCQ